MKNDHGLAFPSTFVVDFSEKNGPLLTCLAVPESLLVIFRAGLILPAAEYWTKTTKLVDGALFHFAGCYSARTRRKEGERRSSLGHHKTVVRHWWLLESENSRPTTTTPTAVLYGLLFFPFSKLTKEILWFLYGFPDFTVHWEDNYEFFCSRNCFGCSEIFWISLRVLMWIKKVFPNFYDNRYYIFLPCESYFLHSDRWIPLNLRYISLENPLIF